MTNEALTRAREVQEELNEVKEALSQFNKASLFSCDEGTRCYRRGSSFLSEAHIMLKGIGVKHLTKRIKELDAEFKKL